MASEDLDYSVWQLFSWCFFAAFCPFWGLEVQIIIHFPRTARTSDILSYHLFVKKENHTELEQQPKMMENNFHFVWIIPLKSLVNTVINIRTIWRLFIVLGLNLFFYSVIFGLDEWNNLIVEYM